MIKKIRLVYNNFLGMVSYTPETLPKVSQEEINRVAAIKVMMHL